MANYCLTALRARANNSLPREILVRGGMDVYLFGILPPALMASRSRQHLVNAGAPFRRYLPYPGVIMVDAGRPSCIAG